MCSNVVSMFVLFFYAAGPLTFVAAMFFVEIKH